MKLEPVYVLAPRPAAPAMPTRRAFLFAGAAFLGGAAAGSAGGWWFGTRSTPEAANAPGPSTPPPIVDDLAWLQPLCHDSSPVEDLIRRRGSLYFAVARPDVDPIIWHGVERVCREVQVNPNLKDRRDIAAELVDLLSGNAITPDSPTRGALLLRHRPALQAIAGGR